jgi:hypothetical protein
VFMDIIIHVCLYFQFLFTELSFNTDEASQNEYVINNKHDRVYSVTI